MTWNQSKDMLAETLIRSALAVAMIPQLDHCAADPIASESPDPETLVHLIAEGERRIDNLRAFIACWRAELAAVRARTGVPVPDPADLPADIDAE